MDVTDQYGEAGSVPPGEPADGTPTVRILLVDDHDDTLLVIRTILEQRGFAVLTATSVDEAHRQAAGGFDLLLSDIDLPDGTGIDLLEKLGRHAPVRAVAMSGYGTLEDIERSLEAGFARHLVKPFTAERLFEAIALALV